jgi:hypothetical protein
LVVVMMTAVPIGLVGSAVKMSSVAEGVARELVTSARIGPRYRRCAGQQDRRDDAGAQLHDVS